MLYKYRNKKTREQMNEKPLRNQRGIGREISYLPQGNNVSRSQDREAFKKRVVKLPSVD
jgi:hypothetical protein